MTGLSNLVDSLRRFVVDLPEWNKLNFNDIELDDKLLEEAVKDGIMRYDLLPPLSTTNIQSLSETSREWYFIKRTSAIELFQRLVIMNIRNQHSVSDPGLIHVDEFNKASAWESLKGNFIMEIEAKATRYKRALALSGMSCDTISMTN
ncbi:MAG: hypothetical protein WCY30_00085 [Candidatus Neomarinimicrobiota bacterium]